MERYVMHLVHLDHDDRWHLQHGDSVLGFFTTKSEAECAGTARGNKMREQGTLAQLVVHREDGSIEFEHTYGKDPERHPG